MKKLDYSSGNPTNQYTKHNYFDFSLVNLLHGNDNKESVWKIVNNTRKNILLSETVTKNFSLPDSQLENIESNETILNITDEDTLQTAGEMFIYLTYSPNRFMFLVKHLFMHSTTKDIILTLNNAMKTLPNNEIETALKIWSNVTKTLDLLHYANVLALVDGTDNSASSSIIGL